MEPNLPNEQPTPAQEAIKQQLEIDKLNAEIRELNKSWYKKPVYLAAMLPAFVAIVSVIILYLNGNFEVKNKELQVKKEALDLDIRKFEIKKDSLAKEIKRSEDTIQIYKLERGSLLKKNDSLFNTLISAKDTIQKFRVNNDSVNKAVSRLKIQITQQGNYKEAQKSIRDLESIIKNYNEKINILQKRNTILEKKILIYEIESVQRTNEIKRREIEKLIAEMDSLIKRKKN